MTPHAKTWRLRARGASVLLLSLSFASCGGKEVRPEGPSGPSRCEPVAIERDVDLDGFRTDRVIWRDAACEPRSASLVRNDAADPAGWHGGYIRRYTYQVAGAQRTCDGAKDGVPGWGMVTCHTRVGETWGNWTEGVTGTGRTLFAGRHHALHEFKWPLPLGGFTVQVTVHYLFATGRSHPLYAITHDASSVPPDALEADVRSPYGDLLFDGNANAEIAGLGWGDRRRFVTLSSPVTMQSGWDYRESNVVPYTRMWTTAPDAEMGVVQTQTWLQKPAGGYWFYQSGWDQRDDDGPMPQDWNWTYQLNQYQLPQTTRSHRMAWGANYGSLGWREYARYGDDGMLSGHPFQSYSVFMVLGTHREDPVLAQADAVEAWQAVRLTATEGTVRPRGPGGVGREDSVAFDTPGYNPVYATWEAHAANNRAELRFDTGTHALEHPVVVLRDYTSTKPPTRVTLDGQPLTADEDYFASVDPDGHALWLTVNRSLTGTATLRVE
ncbi:hypothetical protein LY474_14535 [Myxococcus stipitatus]|uniref:hypothetical protein n=1 Tax=Myxococcus stipitatus TaxID=83455 RepID=UPI001F428AD0|nr:hypothetical protein [Myxococcus stipitatus]MCE9669027.1 hypothetical protein [Myxococcus stipitatus]